jgi:NADH-quinone oxidoreductase subunit N
VLCGYLKRWFRSREAAAKYFLLGALSAGFLLYGIALIYGATGTTRFSELYSRYQAIATTSDLALLLSGSAFVTVGLAFKAAIVPLHMWAPDVYDGAPTPVTAFMAVATKIGAFAAFMRIFMQALPAFNPLWNQAVALLAIPTLVYANCIALQQVQLRRFFAYSGIAHAGLLLIPVAVGNTAAMGALLFYLVVYALATLGCFAILAFLDMREGGVFLRDLNGLFYRSPLLALLLSLSLLTLAGIPPTAGFLAKFYLFKVAIESGYYAVTIVGLLTSILSAAYYLNIIATLFAKMPNGEEKDLPHSPPAFSVAIFCMVAMVALSIYPEPLLHLIATIHHP